MAFSPPEYCRLFAQKTWPTEGESRAPQDLPPPPSYAPVNWKPIKKFSLGAETYVTISCKGFSSVSQVLLISIVPTMAFLLEPWRGGEKQGKAVGSLVNP